MAFVSIEGLRKPQNPQQGRRRYLSLGIRGYRLEEMTALSNVKTATQEPQEREKPRKHGNTKGSQGLAST